MLIGAHVSPAGGRRRPSRAASSAAATRSRSSTRTRGRGSRRSTATSRSRTSTRRMARAASTRCSSTPSTCSTPPATTRRSATRRCASLIASLRAGDALGAHAVVLHPGSAKTGDVGAAIERAGGSSREALAETERCPLHLENTAGTGGTLGRSFEELAALSTPPAATSGSALCLDSCHLLASRLRRPHARRRSPRCSTSAPRSSASSGSARCTSTTRRRRSAPTATATPTSARASSARDGCAVFLSEPRFDGLPCVLETPGPDRRARPQRDRADAAPARLRACAAQ